MPMVNVARISVALVWLVICLIIRGLVPGHDDTPTNLLDSPAVAHNQPAMEQLSERWRALDGVVDAHAGYTEESGSGEVIGYATCDGCDLGELRTKLVGDVWSSDLEKVATFEITVTDANDSSKRLFARYDPVKDAKRLYEKYGNGFINPDRPQAS